MRLVILATFMVAALAAACGDRVDNSTQGVSPASIPTYQAPVGPIQPTQLPSTVPSSTIPSGQLSFRCSGGTGTTLFDVLFPAGTEYHERGVADPVIGIRVVGCFTEPIGVTGQTQALGIQLSSALFSKPSGYRSDDEFYSTVIALLGSFLKSYTTPTATLIVNGVATGQILQVAPLYRQPPATTGPRA